MFEKQLSLLIGGEAGQGIESAGSMLGLCFARAGLNVFAMNEFASRIRGGHNFHKVRVSEEEIYGHLDNMNILVALNQETIDMHINEVFPGGVVVYDGEAKIPNRKDVTFARVPLKKIAVETGGDAVMENTVALGVVLGLL
ncbi:MAG: 2-oxoacid:acceptor oxidoreductase family protein, partial [Patescibacteria group bacterium]